MRALCRDEERARSELPPSVQLVQGDVRGPAADLVAAVGDASALICCLGTRAAADPLGPASVDYAGVVRLVDAARARRVAHFVLVTSIGADQPFFPARPTAARRAPLQGTAGPLSRAAPPPPRSSTS